MKRTPLKRGTKGLSRQSKKRKQENARRSQVLALLREVRRCCELRVIRGCTLAPNDGHEIFTRGRGGSITDPENILLACRPCHEWVTHHPLQAACMGFVVPGWVGEAGLPEAQRLRNEFHQGRQIAASWCEGECGQNTIPHDSSV